MRISQVLTTIVKEAVLVPSAIQKFSPQFLVASKFPLINFASKCLLPAAAAVSIVDGGMALDRLMNHKSGKNEFSDTCKVLGAALTVSAAVFGKLNPATRGLLLAGASCLAVLELIRGNEGSISDHATSGSSAETGRTTSDNKAKDDSSSVSKTGQLTLEDVQAFVLMMKKNAIESCRKQVLEEIRTEFYKEGEIDPVFRVRISEMGNPEMIFFDTEENELALQNTDLQNPDEQEKAIVEAKQILGLNAHAWVSANHVGSIADDGRIENSGIILIDHSQSPAESYFIDKRADNILIGDQCVMTEDGDCNPVTSEEILQKMESCKSAE